MNSRNLNTVASLVCHAHVDMALSCLGSLLANSIETLQLRIHDDGTLTDADRERLIQGLPNCTFVPPLEADDLVLPRLAAYPECLAFRNGSVYGRKLLDVPLLADEEFAFCDSDVLWFRPFEQLLEFPDATTKAVFMSDNQEAYALRPWNLMGRQAVRVPRRVNVGLMLVKREVVDLDFLEWLLGLRLSSFARFPWTEQTCWAALGQRSGCRIWDPQQICVIRDKNCLNQSLVAGHFTSAVRGLMPYPMGAPLEPSKQPSVKLRTIAAHPLGPISLACSQLSRFCRTRVFNR